MRATLLGVSALAAMLSGCSSGISVNSDWDPGVDFSVYSTFAVLDEATNESGLNQLTRNRVKNSIISALTAKGMREVNKPDDADAEPGQEVAEKVLGAPVQRIAVQEQVAGTQELQ